MGKKAGFLMWNRMRITINANTAVEVDTELAQPTGSFQNMSTDEPRINQFTGSSGTIGSRIQVIPLAPLIAWQNIVHSEPFLSADGKIKVLFTNTGQSNVTINVLFWNPHSLVGPGDSDVQSP